MRKIKAKVYEFLLVKELNRNGLRVTMRAVKINRKFMQAVDNRGRHA